MQLDTATGKRFSMGAAPNKTRVLATVSVDLSQTAGLEM